MKFIDSISRAKNKVIKESLSYYYNVPKDRETQLYDFYLISLYYQSMKRVANIENIARTHIDHDTFLDLEIIIDDAIKKIVAVQKKDLLNATLTAIASEFRHVLLGVAGMVEDAIKNISDFSDQAGLNKKKLLQTIKIFNKIFMKRIPVLRSPRSYMKASSEDRSMFRQALQMSKMDHLEFVRIASEAFKSLDWESGYGGKPWIQISQGWIDLNNSSTVDGDIQAIDHIYDLEHNSNVMLDKVQDFSKTKKYSQEDLDKFTSIMQEESDADYIWIKKALDLKFNSSVWQLVKKSSVPLKIAGLFNKITGVENSSYEEFSQKQKQEREKKFTDENKKRKYFINDLFGTLIALFKNKKIQYNHDRISGKSPQYIIRAFNDSKSFYKKITYKIDSKDDGGYDRVEIIDLNSGKKEQTLFVDRHYGSGIEDVINYMKEKLKNSN